MSNPFFLLLHRSQYGSFNTFKPSPKNTSTSTQNRRLRYRTQSPLLFSAFDCRSPHKSIRSIACSWGIAASTQRKWLRQREEIGSPAYQRTRQQSEKLGRRKKISGHQCEMLLLPQKNPVAGHPNPIILKVRPMRTGRESGESEEVVDANNSPAHDVLII